jgi:hypothetical protein
MTQSNSSGWDFIDDAGSFQMRNPHRFNSLYLPLVNEAGIFSAITPTMHGDIKSSHNSFLTPPVSINSLNDSRSAINFWIQVDGFDPWSATGNSAIQVVRHFTDNDEETILQGGILWQQVTRRNSEAGLLAEITSFVPTCADRLELMKITIRNFSSKILNLAPTAAIPIFGRSADNLRDHRHVTSLLHRTSCVRHGVLVSPTLSFDERGHLPNPLIYAVLGVEQNASAPKGFFPVLDDFIGEGGNLDWPQAIVQRYEPCFHEGMSVDGCESLGGLRFETISLSPGDEHSYILMLTIMDSDNSKRIVDEYGSSSHFDSWLERTKASWQSMIKVPRFFTGEERHDGWLRWVTLQPVLRKLFGNSFLPYHDYGRGGRGWRDLWQDILALLVTGNGESDKELFDNFAGVRIDGSNATIIGSCPGEFKADRNNIPRVWMDHGAWPLLATNLFIDQTGDLSILLRPQVYFKDHLVARTQEVDNNWSPAQGTVLQTVNGAPYQGSILEHLLIQHLTPFFNVGEHNNIRLEGADWNDALDMAAQRGESVAFTAFYAGNLERLSELTLALQKLDIVKVEIAEEILPLVDTLSERINYDLVSAKQEVLARYFRSCQHELSGNKVVLSLQDLASDLRTKSDWLSNHIRMHEWLINSEGYGWFNGYYDNQGKRVEGDFPNGVRMTLTGQVFALMGGVANEDQVKEVIRSVDRYLYDAEVGGYRLNTNFGEVLLDLGRGFGFAYGHKENGAMFSHMAVMYANALYQRGMVRKGFKVLDDIYQYCQDFSRCRIYPGIPEYINARGQGMYTYLTGSASWYLLTLLTEAFGVHGRLGDMMLMPKLVREQFNRDGIARVMTRFAGRELEICYFNSARLDFGEYRIDNVSLDEKPIDHTDVSAVIPRLLITSLDPRTSHTLQIELK